VVGINSSFSEVVEKKPLEMDYSHSKIFRQFLI